MIPPPAYGSIRIVDVEQGAQERAVGAMSIDEKPPLQTTTRDSKTQHRVLGTSHFWVAEDEIYMGLHSIELKAAFIRKVYGLLTAQLLVTVFTSAVLMASPSEFVMNNASAIMLLSSAGAFATLIGLIWFKDRYPYNYWLLSLFTVFEALSIGSICAAYAQAHLSSVILNAFTITFVVFAGLSVFAIQTKIDFTPFNGILIALLWSLVVVGIISTVFGFTLGLVHAWLGSLLFSCFIIVDTQLIMQRMGYDDYIIATIELYLDFLNLFLFILRILTETTGGRDQNRN